MRWVYLLILAVSSAAARPAYAEQAPEEVIARALEAFWPEVEITRISPTPIANLYEVMIGPDVIYMSGDGRFVLRGDLLDLRERRNLSEDQREEVRKAILEKLPAKDYIEFAPAKTEHIVYVFTDVDCSFCRRLHRDVPELNARGIAVRYLAFPRGGAGTRTYDVMQSVWCSSDRRQALTDAKNGKAVKPSQCASPVASHLQLGQKFGVRGTPAIYLENGQELPGYTPPDELLSIVGK